MNAVPPAVISHDQPGPDPQHGPTPTAHVRAALDELTRLSVRSWGVWSVADAGRLGLTSAELAGLLRAGRLWRPARGWYAVVEPDAAPARLHAQRARSLVGRQGGAAVASHHSALILSEVPVHGADLSVVHLTSTGEGSFRTGPGYVVHARNAATRRLGDDRDVAGDAASTQTSSGCASPVEPIGLTVPRPIRATVPLAHAVIQTGLLSGPVDAIIAGDHLLRRKQLTREELVGTLTGYRHCRGISSVARAVGWVDPKAESVGESVLRYAMHLLGYPLSPQFVVRRDDRVWRIDLVVKGTRVAVEFDGTVKYANPEEPQRRACGRS